MPNFKKISSMMIFCFIDNSSRWWISEATTWHFRSRSMDWRWTHYKHLHQRRRCWHLATWRTRIRSKLQIRYNLLCFNWKCISAAVFLTARRFISDPRFLVFQVVPEKSQLDQVGEEMDVVIAPHSLTSIDLLINSNVIRTVGSESVDISSY